MGSAPASQLLMNGAPVDATWSAGSVQFKVPDNAPAAGAGWAGPPKAVQLAVSATGQLSNPVTFTVAAPEPSTSTSTTGAPDGSGPPAKAPSPV
jgi:hypothetical protein